MAEATIDKCQVAASFGKAAASYDQAAAFQRRVGHDLMARLPAWKGFVDIVDLGCGTGYFTRALAERLGQPVRGLDIAEGMLRFARAQGGGGGDWVAADAEALPVRSASQDLVFSSLALQWCPALERALAEGLRVLRPGGCMAFSTLLEGSLEELRESWRVVDGYVHVNRFGSLAWLQRQLAAAGFARWDCQIDVHVLRYGHLSELTRELKALGAHNLNAGRPGGLTGRARLRALTEAYEQYREADGLPATYQVAQVVLFKSTGSEDVHP